MIFSKIFNLVFIGILVFFIIKMAPSVQHRFQLQGTTDSVLKIFFGKKRLYIFWATWCPPCKVELRRLNFLIQMGFLKPEDVIAINMGEDPVAVMDFVKKAHYDFVVETDSMGEVSQAFAVDTTPTILLIDESNKIVWATSGISPTLEVRVLSFFKMKEGLFWNLLKIITLSF